MNLKFVLMILCLSVALFSCSSVEKRTRFTDKNMRVMIDPDSIAPEHHVRIQRALVASGMFAVIDRSKGMNAIKKEQERLHRNEVDRFEDREKWAHWGKLYGVGAIVVAHVQCFSKQSFWNPQMSIKRCDQFLSLMDANTGEIIMAVEGQADTENIMDSGYQLAPSWDEVVEKFTAAYPKDFKFVPYSTRLVEYQDLSEEAARRQKEVAGGK
jgi:hypothetical protein